MILMLLLQLLPTCSGFFAVTSSRTIVVHSSVVSKKSRHIKATLFNSVDRMAAAERQLTIDDKNGDSISVGCVVRVAAENLKAYQVPAKGYGKFNENKEFVPATAGGERETKSLLLPVGLRGVVAKVYNVEAVSSNFPIQVKFTPGENTDEGYDPPVAFLMHFGSREVECV